MKKIVLILFLVYAGIGFSQEKGNPETSTVALIKNVNAYPNPFKDKTSIFFDASENEDITISVQNILGKVVFIKKIKAKQGKNILTFYRNHLSAGIYVYTVASKNDKISKRLVIK
jgi:hypothetical protein